MVCIDTKMDIRMNNGINNSEKTCTSSRGAVVSVKTQALFQMLNILSVQKSV